jgi:hypothetical protein
MHKRSLFDRFIIFLARLWKVDNIEFKSFSIDNTIMVLVAHGATTNKLTNGAKAVLKKALDFRSSNYIYDIFFGSFDVQPNSAIEKTEKHNVFGRANWIGNVLSTITECLVVRDKLTYNPQNILVITDEAHSRRCRIVWRTIFPKAKIYIITVPIEDCVDPESPMETYHKLWKILWNQAYPTPIFWFCSLFGEKFFVKVLGKVHQPLAK